MIRTYQNHKLQTNSRHREEQPQDAKKTNQAKQSSLL